MSVREIAKPAILSEAVLFVDGRAFSPSDGGIVWDGGNYYSVANTDMVYEGQDAKLTNEGWEVPRNRVGSGAGTGILNIKESSSIGEVQSLGAEQELSHLDQEGRYANLKDSTEMNEFSAFMLERASKVSHDGASLKRSVQKMTVDAVDYAEKNSQLVAALSVFGQHELTPQYLNPHPYVDHVLGEMALRTGFDASKLFAVGGYQAHTGVTDTLAGLKAVEAMQSLSPILMTPSLAGPLYNGYLGPTKVSQPQREHLAIAGLTLGDFRGSYKSWRMLLRVAGSPSSGIWRMSAPDSVDEYLQLSNAMLAKGEINTSDRLFGWHADRFRAIMPGGASTIEDCSTDTAAGNPETLVALHMLRSSLTTALEAMAMQGQDPSDEVAKIIGTRALSREQRLSSAHNLALRQSARFGNDAVIYGKKPGQWLDALFALADKSPQFKLDGGHKNQLRRMFADDKKTQRAIKKWCYDNNTDTPTLGAYFDLGIGTPATYMLAQYEQEQKNHPKATNEELIRKVELGAAFALHQYVHSL